MADGKGSLSLGTTKAAAAATGPQGSPTGSATKRKAAKDPPSCCRMPRPRATKEQKEEPEAAEAPTVAAAGEQNYQLSKAYIRWILALKPMEPPARLAALKRSNPDWPDAVAGRGGGRGQAEALSPSQGVLRDGGESPDGAGVGAQ
jgi:hypothetical protein